MAKRFTDTEKWNKHFVRGLQAPYKLLWLYICDECTTAGLWDVDIDVAQIKLGVKLKRETAIASFGEKIVQIDGGRKWFIPSFIEFQYGQLSEANRAHTKAIFALKKLGLLDADMNIKPLTSPLQGDKVEVEDMVVLMEEEEVKEREPEFEIIMPPGFTDDFSRAWAAWKNYRLKTHKFKYKTEESEQAAISQLVKKGSGREANCLEIIEHSISRQWEGLILTEELKKQFDVTGPNQNKSGNRPATGGNVSTARAFSAIDAFYDSIGER